MSEVATAQPITVSDAIGLAKATVDHMPTLLVSGEVTGFRGPARTGHCYFQLKDESCAMDAIVWKGIYQASGIQLQVAGVAHAHAHNETLAVDGDVRHFEFAGGQMENSGVFDDQMRFACASRSGNSFTEVHDGDLVA